MKKKTRVSLFSSGQLREKCLLEYHFIEQLFGQDFIVKPLDFVEISQETCLEFQRYLDALCDTGERGERWRGSQLDLESRFAVLLPNLTLPLRHEKSVDHLIVEIKPKWGFIPYKHPLHHHSIKQSKCRNCMHQHLKLAQNKIEAVSEDICLMSLYSSNRNEIINTIRSLLKNPQNNLALYQNGKRISESQKYESRLPDLIADILLSSKVLLKLAEHQKNLDRHSIEYCHDLYMNMEKDEIERIRRDIDLWQCTIDQYVNNCDKELTQEQIIIEYLLSMTLKDVSIMININFLEQEAEFQNNVVYDLKLIDVDLKPVEKIPHYHKQDCEIVHSYLSSIKAD